MESKFNTEAFWYLARQHKLDYVVYHCMGYVEEMSNLREIKQQASSLFDKYGTELKKVCLALKAAEVEFRVVKGIFLSQVIYEDFWFRNPGDIDLVVNAADLEKAFSIIKSLGYETVGNPGNDRPKFNLGLFFCEIKMKKENIAQTRRIRNRYLFHTVVFPFPKGGVRRRGNRYA